MRSRGGNAVAPRSTAIAPSLAERRPSTALAFAYKHGACDSRGEALSHSLRCSTLVPLLALVSGAACSRTQTGDRPQAEYDEAGHLRRIVYDANYDGRNDSASYTDPTGVIRIEVDLDGNGHTERWLFYRENGTLAKIGISRDNDGVMDTAMHYADSGTVERIEVSTRRDATFDRIEFYENGALVRTQEDTNRDGRPDKWETYEPAANTRGGEPRYVVRSVAFDTTGRGVPEKRFVFGRDGVVQRVEVEFVGEHSVLPQRPNGQPPAGIR